MGFKVGQTVVYTPSGALLEIVELPVPPGEDRVEQPGEPRMMVRYKDAPNQIRRVDPKLCEPAPDKPPAKIEPPKGEEPPKK